MIAAFGVACDLAALGEAVGDEIDWVLNDVTTDRDAPNYAEVAGL